MTRAEDELSTEGPLDPVLRRRLTDALAEAVDLQRTFTASHRLPTHPSSALRRDEATGNAASAFNTASAALVGSLDHLLTWYQVVAGDLVRFPIPVFSPYTLARGAYEPALLTLWLLDSEADSVTRIGRGYAAQLRSLEDMRTFQADAGMTGEAANGQALLDRLLSAARAAGYVGVDSRGKERMTVQVPTMVELFNRYDQAGNPTQAKAAWLYRLLSGNAHGREWAVMRGARAVPVEGLDTDISAVPADVPTMCALAERAALVVRRAVIAHRDYRTSS